MTLRLCTLRAKQLWTVELLDGFFDLIQWIIKPIFLSPFVRCNEIIPRNSQIKRNDAVAPHFMG
jgi:hypothetical protein